MSMQYPRAALAVLLLVAGPALAQDGGRPGYAPDVPLTHSVEQADARLAEVAAARAKVNQEFAADEQVCNEKFFVNYCLDQAKEKRRVALAGLRAVEVEANRFKRQAAVDKRDAELAERLKKDAEEDARRAAAPQRTHAEHAPAGPTAKPGPSLDQRQAEHDAKERRRQQQEAADAPKRAENVAAFERKQQESEHRRARVAERMAERAEKARKKAEAAAAKAEAAANAAKAAAAKETK
jgi:colicin import membrane protein